MLEVKDVNQFYGGSHILRDVSFQAPVGECSVVLGRNGVGKTTLLKCLMGILPIKSGQILLDGQDISKMSPEQRVRAGLAYVPQGRDIFSTLTVEENILIGMAKFKGAKTRKVPEHLYEIFPILDEMKHRRGGDLSGGQQQQLAIARALASEPRVLILDEPTEGIQPSIIKDIGRVIRKLADGGDMAVVLVEQFYDFAEELADAYTVMARGQSRFFRPGGARPPTQIMVDFIHNNKDRYGVEAICRILPIAASTYYRTLDLADNPEHRAKRDLHDEHHAEQIKRIWKESSGRYGVRKVWQKLKREGYIIARCTVARLMQKLGIQGVWRGKNKQTTRSRDDQKRADDLVKRNFNADHPDQLWVGDFTYIQTHSGWVYTAFAENSFGDSNV
jgi:urea transport system ATP-binding protein